MPTSSCQPPSPEEMLTASNTTPSLLRRLGGRGLRPLSWFEGEVRFDASAAALSLLINSTGNVNVRLKPLLTVEDLDAAAKKTPSYRAPGQ